MPATAVLPAVVAAVQTVGTDAFVVVVARLVTPSSPRGSHWLWAALHTPEDPLSHWAGYP